MPKPPRVFISYARQDGEAFAQALRERLEREEPALTLWLDRAQMEGGRSWWKQITDALDGVEFMVVVMTPAALTSLNTRKEWRYARQRGVCVYPVKGRRDAELDYKALPQWMRKAHFYDLEHEWETFLRYLKDSCRTTRVPFMAPDLPRSHVERPVELQALLGSVLDTRSENPIPGTVALHGAGGFGKTTLATALCHHDDVITVFDDGILWVTLGPKPDVLEGLTTLYAALTGNRLGFVDEEDAAHHLVEVLEDKSCLIVLDDVWDAASLKPFLRGGRDCTRLVTTRQFELAAEFRRIDAGEMAPPQAVQVLTARLETPPSDLRPFRELAKRMGAWPLMLALAGATLRQLMARRYTLEGALTHLDQALRHRGVVAFDQRNATERHQAISQTIEISLELLHEEERARFIEIAIFPPATSIPLTEVGTLWRMDDFDTEELVLQLDNLSLLRFDAPLRTLRVHDVMREYLASQVRDTKLLHSRLVGAWKDWYHLPDAYAWRWLSYHLTEAGRVEELERLLLDFDWLQAKLEAPGDAGLLSDYQLARKHSSLESPRLHPLRLLEEAIRLSAPALGRDKTQFAGQLCGRLLAHESAEVQAVLHKARQWAGAPWLRPLTQSLTSPGGPLLATLAGHEDALLAAAVTPDWSYAVSASADRTLKCWDLREGTERWTLRGHTDRVLQVAVTPDAQRAISSSLDRTLRLWDLESGKELRTIHAPPQLVSALAMTSDGRYAISGSEEQTLRLWDLESGKERWSRHGHTAPISEVFVTPDNQRVLSISDDLTLKVWDLESGAELHTISCYPLDSQFLALSTRDGQYAVAPYGEVLGVWNLQPDTGAVTDLEFLRGHSARVNAVAATPDERYIVSASSDGLLKVWDLKAKKEVRTLQGHTTGVRAVAVSPRGDQAVSAAEDGTLKVWSLETGTELRTLEGHGGQVNAVVLTPDGEQAISASTDQTLKVWLLGSGTERFTLRGHVAGVTHLAMLPDGQRVVSASEDGTLRIWDLETGRERAVLRGQGGPVVALTVAPDGRHAVSASDDGILRLWELEAGRELHSLRGHTGRVWALAITPDGQRIVSAARDDTVRVWSLHAGEALRLVELARGKGTESLLLDGHLWTLTMTPDGSSVFISNHYFGCQFVDVASGSITLISYFGRRSTFALTPDCRRALAAMGDATLTLWNLESGAELLSRHTRGGPLTAVTMTPNAQRALSFSKGAPPQLWNLEDGSVVDVDDLEVQGDVFGALLTPDGRRAIIRHVNSHSLLLFNLETKVSYTIPDSSRSFSGRVVFVKPDSRRALSVSDDQTLKMWDLESEPALQTRAEHRYAVEAVTVTPDGRHAVSAGAFELLKVWDLETGREFRSLPHPGTHINTLHATQDGQYLISISNKNSVKVWNMATGAELRTFRLDEGWALATRMTPDGRRAVSALDDGTLKVWDMESGREVVTFTGHLEENVLDSFSVFMLQGGRRIASATLDSLRVWDLECGEEVRSFALQETGLDIFTTIAVTPDGCRAVLNTYQGELPVLDLREGKVLFTLSGHTSLVNAAALTPDGRYLASVANDATLRLWDLEQQKPLAIFSGDDPLITCALAPAGTALIAGSMEGRVHLLRLQGQRRRNPSAFRHRPGRQRDGEYA